MSKEDKFLEAIQLLEEVLLEHSGALGVSTELTVKIEQFLESKLN